MEMENGRGRQAIIREHCLGFGFVNEYVVFIYRYLVSKTWFHSICSSKKFRYKMFSIFHKFRTIWIFLVRENKIYSICNDCKRIARPELNVNAYNSLVTVFHSLCIHDKRAIKKKIVFAANHRAQLCYLAIYTKFYIFLRTL